MLSLFLGPLPILSVVMVRILSFLSPCWISTRSLNLELSSVICQYEGAKMVFDKSSHEGGTGEVAS